MDKGNRRLGPDQAGRIVRGIDVPNEDAKRRGGERSPSAGLLLDATAQLLAEVTTVDVSLSEIAKRAAVNSALIKYYYGNKEGLLLALLEREAKTAMASLKALAGMEMPAEKKLKLHINAIIDAFYWAPYVNRLIHYLVDSGSPQASRRVTELYTQPMIAVYRAIVEQGVREGVMQPVNPGLLYYCLAGAADHIFHAAYSVPATLGVTALDEGIKQQYAALVSGIFLRGLAP